MAGCCGKRRGAVVAKKVKNSDGTYYSNYKYLTPQQMTNQRKKNEGKIWCTGCDGGKSCDQGVYFECAKRMQLGV